MKSCLKESGLKPLSSTDVSGEDNKRTVASEFVPEFLEGIFTLFFYGLLMQRYTAAGHMNDNNRCR